MGDSKASISDILRGVGKSLDNYKRVFILSHQNKYGGVSSSSVFDDCQNRLAKTPHDELLHFYSVSGGDFRVMALSMIDTSCDYADFLLYQDIKLRGQTNLAEDASQYIEDVRSFYKDQVAKIMCGFPVDDTDDEPDAENAEESDSQDDELPDSFEEVELSKKKDSHPVKKKETRLKKNPLLILCIVLLSAVVIMLPIVTYYCGLGKGYSEGYSVGKDDWYDDGYGDGSDDGYKKGYNSGYDDGRAAVDLEVPYDAGYEAGYSDALNGY